MDLSTGATITSYATPYAVGGANSGGVLFDIIPEPGMFVLLGVAAAGAYVFRRRRKAS